jgi:hypothetical protein
MAPGFPFLTSADPVASSEGTLDPLGLYQISDQLASKLVPAVRERMIRIRFLTAMAVGSFVTEGLEGGQSDSNSSPYLAWEWHVVESIVRCREEVGGEDAIRGVPGTVVARRAIGQHGYLDARSYLATPRVFGFHGVYKRLAHHLGITNVHLGHGGAAERLVDAWAQDRGLGGLRGAAPLLKKWGDAVKRSLAEPSPRTRPGWAATDWKELAHALLPAGAGTRERKCLRGMLLRPDAALGALPDLWTLQEGNRDEHTEEAALHDRLEALNPAYAPMLQAIRAYESFSRSLQDAFDVLRHRAARIDSGGFALSAIAADSDFRTSVAALPQQYAAASTAIGLLGEGGSELRALFTDRFATFESPIDPAHVAFALRALHERVQREKSAEGKRPWFDSFSSGRIYVRPAYRIDQPTISPGQYLHAYRGAPIRRFYLDLERR